LTLFNTGSPLWQIAVALGLLLLGLGISFLLTALLRRRHRREPITVAGMPVQLAHWRGPLRLLLPALTLRAGLAWIGLTPELLTAVEHILILWIIAAVGWLARRTVSMARQMVMIRYPVDVEDNLQARRIRTQFQVIERVLVAVIVLIVISAMLMTFEQVRQFGVSLLASAGVAGVVLGFAAQKSLGTLLAGIQIAFSQPIRLDDVVIVEGEWGRVEEITLTYVVVKIWDERRLIVPITYFIDNAFQNWTRSSAQILGTVYIYADYSLPVDELRSELKRILDGSPLFDGRAWGLQVTNASDRTIELRALMSAEDASKSWDLRCHVREALIRYLQTQHPESLPRIRLEQKDAPGE
jgi:small-conductance mechanosensitive channel